jgi:hypothetical protein
MLKKHKRPIKKKVKKTHRKEYNNDSKALKLKIIQEIKSINNAL